jgi:hypothetical protein
MEISHRSFAKIMAFTLISTLVGCSNISSTLHPTPKKASQIIPSAEVLPRISPWFRSYENADMKLSSDDNHTMEFSHWIENSLVLDGKNTSFKYDKKNHYQLGNRGTATTSDVYYVYEIEKLYSLLKTTQPYWPDDVNPVVDKIISGAVKINRGVIHWHRHHEKLKAPSKFKLTETYCMIIYAESEDRDTPVLEITHNSIARFKRDSLSSDVEHLFSKAESTVGLFRAPDSVVVTWQELPETIGFSRKNIFWVAADLEASHSTKTIYYFGDESDPASHWVLFLLYSPDQHAGNVLTEYRNVILNRGENGLPTFTVETINGISHSKYFHLDNGWIEVEVVDSGTEMPNENGEAFNTFLQFLHVSIPGMVSYVGDGQFSVITQPQGSLVVERGRTNSPMAGSSIVAIEVMKNIGGPAQAIETGVLAARAVANRSDY